MKNNAVIVLLILGCASKGFDRENSRSSASGGKSWGFPAGMAPVKGDRPFWIDKYEVSDLDDGMIAARNQSPRVQISQEQASASCARAGRRLCTLAEWKTACLGIRRNRFSYGHNYIENRCNIHTGITEPSGFRAECRNEENVYDLIGNLMEWVSDIEHGKGVVAGGGSSGGIASDCFTKQYFPSQTNSNIIGFRCCLESAG